MHMRAQERRQSLRTGTKIESGLMKEVSRLCSSFSQPLIRGTREELPGAAVFSDLLLFGLEMRPQTSREADPVTFSVGAGWPLL